MTVLGCVGGGGDFSWFVELCLVTDNTLVQFVSQHLFSKGWALDR